MLQETGDDDDFPEALPAEALQDAERPDALAAALGEAMEDDADLPEALNRHDYTAAVSVSQDLYMHVCT